MARSDDLVELQRIETAYERRAARRHDERYGLAEPQNLYLYQRRERVLLDEIRRRGIALSASRVIDVGCGEGNVLRDFARYRVPPARLTGVELQPDRVRGSVAANPAIPVLNAEASALPFADASFDVALQFTLLSSVLSDELRRRIAAETVRVVRPGGWVIIYDFVWNPGNPDVSGVGAKTIRRLYPGCEVALRPVTLAPPIARRLAKVSWTACRLLEAVPWLCSHRLTFVRTPATRRN